MLRPALLKHSRSVLHEHGIGSAHTEADWLLCAALGIRRSALLDPVVVDPASLARVEQYLQRRCTGEPLAYIHGEVEFLNCRIRVSPAVLIPRPETEILAASIVDSLKHVPGGTLWDLCTGSGCLGIAIKAQCPQLKVVLSDISLEALELAKANAELNGVDVEFRHGDLLQPFAGEKADYVVCNPPYLAEEELASLDFEVRDFEPQGALVSGPSGLEIYERLAEELPGHLNPGAKLWLEISYLQGKSVPALFEGGVWEALVEKKELLKDWSGQDRFFLLEFRRFS